MGIQFFSMTPEGDPAQFYANLFGKLGNYRECQAEMLIKAMQMASFGNTEGDYIEFGVFAGESMALAYNAWLSTMRAFDSFEAYGFKPPATSRMRFFGFDSFQGMPPPKGIDKLTTQQDFHEGFYACSLEHTLENLRAAGVAMDTTWLIEGWYEHTLTPDTIAALGLEKAAIVHIDCDFYESAKKVLDFITPLVGDGTVLLFDDWYCNQARPDMGEQRAFREWLCDHEELRTQPYTQYCSNGMSFAVNRD